MWSEHGWKRITANEAARLHPGGIVSAESGLFKCELCGADAIGEKGHGTKVYFNSRKIDVITIKKCRIFLSRTS